MLLKEARLFISCGVEVMGKELERDIAVQLGVMGPVNHTHASFTKLLEDPIMRNRLPYHATPPPTLPPAHFVLRRTGRFGGSSKSHPLTHDVRGPFCPPDRTVVRAGDMPPSSNFSTIL